MRFLLDLAVHGNEDPVSLNDVSHRQGISEKYLWQVVAPLKSSGFIESVRGAGGGYRLARPASKINLRMVLEKLESPTHAVLQSRKTSGRDREAGAVVRTAIESLSSAWSTAAESITLASLVEDHRRTKARGALMYEI